MLLRYLCLFQIVWHFKPVKSQLHVPIFQSKFTENFAQTIYKYWQFLISSMNFPSFPAKVRNMHDLNKFLPYKSSASMHRFHLVCILGNLIKFNQKTWGFHGETAINLKFTIFIKISYELSSKWSLFPIELKFLRIFAIFGGYISQH